MTIIEWLDEVQVMPPSYGKNREGPMGWYAVSTSEGIMAYFLSETDALRFRLEYINFKLNGAPE